MKALFLGGPLHAQTRDIEWLKDRLDMVIEVEPETRTHSTFSGGGWRPAVTHTHPYVRVEIPGSDAAVYVAEGYEPTPEDEEFVLGWVREQ